MLKAFPMQHLCNYLKQVRPVLPKNLDIKTLDFNTRCTQPPRVYIISRFSQANSDFRWILTLCTISP